MLNPAIERVKIMQLGEQIRWLKATPCDCYDPSTNYSEQATCELCEHGLIYTDEGGKRGIISQMKRDMEHPDIGWINAGTLTLTVDPAAFTLGKFDRIVLLQRTYQERETINVASNVLSHEYPTQILAASDRDATYVEGTDFRFNATTRTLTWITAGPDDVYIVEYGYNPVYWWCGVELTAARPAIPTGASTARMPMVGLLTESPPGA